MTARIYKPARTAMQSGHAKTKEWLLDYEPEQPRTVEPLMVFEVAFNNVMRSDRHESGYALRFPRIVRLRPDKSPDEADTIERVQEIYASQERGK